MSFIIKEYRPGKRLATWLVVAGLWIASVWLAYEGSRYLNDRLYIKIANDHDLLQAQVRELEAANDALKLQASRLQRTAQIDRQAKIELTGEVKKMQDHEAELRKELSLYKSIIAPDTGRAGLTVHNFTVRQLEGRTYRYELVLTQSGKSDSLSEGNIELVIKGVQHGKVKSFNLNEIQVTDSQLSYRFRYFQRLNGDMRLPEGFEPTKMTVKFIPRSGAKLGARINDFDWQKVTLQKE